MISPVSDMQRQFAITDPRSCIVSSFCLHSSGIIEMLHEIISAIGGSELSISISSLNLRSSSKKLVSEIVLTESLFL